MRGEGQADDGTGEEAENGVRRFGVHDGDGLKGTHENDCDTDHRGEHRYQNIIQFILGLIRNLLGPGDRDGHEVKDGYGMGEGAKEGAAHYREMQPADLREVGLIVPNQEEERVGREDVGEGFTNGGHGGLGDGASPKFARDPAHEFIG